MLRRRAGFTLVEMMISIIMLAIVMGGVVSTMVSMQRGYIRQREIARTEDALRVAEMTITRILQTAGSNSMDITGASAPRIDPIAATAPFTQLRVVADFNPVNGVITDPLEDMQVLVSGDTLYVRWQSGQLPARVAFPVRSLAFQYDSNGTVLTTTAAVTRAATRVRITLEAPRHSRTNVLARRVSWVYLRNRHRY
jgi:prepilin-type N-terminal cleavage/methylation domain-containing protein